MKITDKNELIKTKNRSSCRKHFNKKIHNMK